MYKICTLLGACIFAITAHSATLDEAIQALSDEIPGQTLQPQTTAELSTLFKDATATQVPRIFVEKLPQDFATNGSPELFVKVMTSLVLRSNERTLRDKLILTELKNKYDKGIKWTETEETFFQTLVQKYDVVVKKTIPTQLEQLMIKVDEVTPGLAVAQAAYATDWGKKNLTHPFMQMGWLDEEHYQPIEYDSLIKATDAYVQEMNAAPNYWLWRVQRQRATHRGNRKRLAYTSAGNLRSYLPEDPLYTITLQQLIINNPELKDLYDATFLK